MAHAGSAFARGRLDHPLVCGAALAVVSMSSVVQEALAVVFPHGAITFVALLSAALAAAGLDRLMAQLVTKSWSVAGTGAPP